MKRPAAVSELLSTLFAGTPAANRLKEGAIWEVWSSAVGAQIASRARPCAIRNGVLTVVVSSAPWMQQLNFMKVQIREKLNDAVGEELVKDIYLKSGSLREEVENSAPRTFKKMEQRALSSEEKDAVAKATEEVADPELRNTLASFFSLHLSNQKNQDSPKTPSAS
jgi:hypothetical protein